MPNNFSQFSPNSYQTPQYQSFFPQPQGSLYLINNSLELSNVPVGSNLSAAICAQEGLLYIKTFQNGAPIVVTYSLLPYEQKTEQYPQLEERIATIEKKLEQMSKGGVKLNDLI